MPNIKSQIKTMSKDAERRLRNRALRTMLLTELRQLDDAIKAGDREKAQVCLKDSIKRIDKSVTKGILHPNTAARKKSRISARLKTLA